MFAAIKQNLTRLSLFNTNRDDLKGMFYWYSVITLCSHAGMADGFMGVVGGFILGLPLYVWLFHMGEEKEPTLDA